MSDLEQDIQPFKENSPPIMLVWKSFPSKKRKSRTIKIPTHIRFLLKIREKFDVWQNFFFFFFFFFLFDKKAKNQTMSGKSDIVEALPGIKGSLVLGTEVKTTKK